jgi:hypothetical protein
MTSAPYELVERIREAFLKGDYTLLQLHGFERMIERGIHPRSIRQAVLDGKPIEYDPAGTRGKYDSVLFNGEVNSRPIKVAEQTTARGYRHFVVTAYEPDANLWHNSFSQRRKL